MTPGSSSSAAADRFDPVTLEVIRHRLDMVAEEMQSTLLRSSCSPIVKEGLDASASLFTLDGTTLAQACAIAIHLGTLIPAVASILARFPVEQMRDGDIYILNDPYSGGTHLPDFAVVMPIFAAGRPIALAATMTHHQDVGGKTAGSVPTNSTEIYQEGLRIPPVAWAREGRFDETLTAVLRLNVRIPDIFMGDLHAQVAACKIAAVRLGEAVSKFGDNTLLSAFSLLLDRAEAMTRAALRRLKPGTYRAVDYLDNDGIDLDRRIRIEVAATVGDGTIHFDLTGSSPQVKGPINCVPSGSLAAACFAVRAVTDPSIPNNGGCFRPIRLTLPPASIVNPVEPAPVNARTATIKRITNTMLMALAEVAPERVPAPNSGELLVMAWGGLRRGGASFVTGELLAGGAGAGDGFDGVDAIETDATNCMNLPVEAMELDAPIRVHRWQLVSELRRCRPVSRWPWPIEGIRDPRRCRRHRVLRPSWRAPLHRGLRRGGRVGRWRRPVPHRAGRWHTGGDPLEDRRPPGVRRSRRDLDRRWRRLRPSRDPRARGRCKRHRRRQDQRAGSGATNRVASGAPNRMHRGAHRPDGAHDQAR